MKCKYPFKIIIYYVQKIYKHKINLKAFQLTPSSFLLKMAETEKLSNLFCVYIFEHLIMANNWNNNILIMNFFVLHFLIYIFRMPTAWLKRWQNTLTKPNLIMRYNYHSFPTIMNKKWRKWKQKKGIFLSSLLMVEEGGCHLGYNY